jgi:glycosyltransferase involved in cell wall biosynthesis
MKRLLLLTYYWPPAGGAGVQRWLKLCRYLPEMGVQCTVITVDPQHASYPVTDPEFETEVPEGVEVIRTRSFEPLRLYSRMVGRDKVPHGGFANVNTETTGSKISRWVRGNLFIPDARKGWVPYATDAALKAIDRHTYQAIITTGPPHSTHLAGLRLKALTGLPWIADFRDPWTDIYYYAQLLHTRFARRRDQQLELQVLQQADTVLAVCPSNQRLLQSKLPAHQYAKVKVLTNGYDEADFAKPIAQAPRDVLHIGYTGTIAATYRPETIFDALAALDVPWRLRMAGQMPDDVWHLATQRGITPHIERLGYLPHSEALRVVRSSHVLLHIVPDTDANRMGTTGKLFEYIGAAVPILNVGPAQGDSAQFVARAGCGRTFSRNEAPAITAWLRDLYHHPVTLQPNHAAFSRRALAAQLRELI